VSVNAICVNYQRLERTFEGELRREGEGGGGQEVAGALGLLEREGSSGHKGQHQARGIETGSALDQLPPYKFRRVQGGSVWRRLYITAN
jgi:hypothetical protein